MDARKLVYRRRWIRREQEQALLASKLFQQLLLLLCEVFLHLAVTRGWNVFARWNKSRRIWSRAGGYRGEERNSARKSKPPRLVKVDLLASNKRNLSRALSNVQFYASCDSTILRTDACEYELGEMRLLLPFFHLFHVTSNTPPFTLDVIYMQCFICEIAGKRVKWALLARVGYNKTMKQEFYFVGV